MHRRLVLVVASVHTISWTRENSNQMAESNSQYNYTLQTNTGMKYRRVGRYEVTNHIETNI